MGMITIKQVAHGWHIISFVIGLVSLIGWLLANEDNKQTTNPNKEVPAYIKGTAKDMAIFLVNTDFPTKAFDEFTEGRLYIRFTIETDGSITKPHVPPLFNPGPKVIREAVIEYIANMPNWTPAKVKGKPVKSSPTLFLNYWHNHRNELRISTVR